MLLGRSSVSGRLEMRALVCVLGLWHTTQSMKLYLIPPHRAGKELGWS